MAHPTKIYHGQLYYLGEDIRQIDSGYRMRNIDGDEEILGEICIGTSMYPIWIRVIDVAEMITW